MKLELPVIWTVGGATHAGRIELVDDRVTLTSGIDSVSFAAATIAAFAIERAPAERLRGLPVLSARLADGRVVRVASLGGAGSLHELAAWVGARQPAATGT
jgi:hypothetical protein